MAQVAVHPDSFRRGDHEVRGQRPLSSGPVFGVRADVDDLLRIAEFVDDLVAVIKQVVQVTDDRAQVLSGRDRAPSTDGVKRTATAPSGRSDGVSSDFTSYGDRSRARRTSAIRRALPIPARPLPDGELVGASECSGLKSRRPRPYAGEEARHGIRRCARG